MSTGRELAARLRARRRATTLSARLEASDELLRRTADRLEKQNLELRRRMNQLERVAAGLAGIGDEAFRETAAEVVPEGRTLLGYDRLHGLWQAVRNAAGVEGSMAELGSFRGGSAHFLMLATRRLHGSPRPTFVLDTFEGHPEHEIGDGDRLAGGGGQRAGKFSETSLEAVREYLRPFDEADVRRCVVPDGLAGLPGDHRYALVHLDMDLHGPTLRALEYFWPRMPAGGVVVIDDFRSPSAPGIEQAFDEFRAGLEPGAMHAWDLRSEQIVISKL